jgi:hypothetical protein
MHTTDQSIGRYWAGNVFSLTSRRFSKPMTVSVEPLTSGATSDGFSKVTHVVAEASVVNGLSPEIHDDLMASHWGDVAPDIA